MSWKRWRLRSSPSARFLVPESTFQPRSKHLAQVQSCSKLSCACQGPNSCSNCAMSPPKRSCSEHLGPQKSPWSHELLKNPIPTWLLKFRNLGRRERGSTQTHVLHHPLDHLKRQWWPPDTAGHIVDSKRIGICWSYPSPTMDSWRVKTNQEMNH